MVTKVMSIPKLSRCDWRCGSFSFTRSFITNCKGEGQRGAVEGVAQGCGLHYLVGLCTHESWCVVVRGQELLYDGHHVPVGQTWQEVWLEG